ncbi:hypothetical protein JW906_13500 [bacterium]|nr:hypothetical protein [bacterium]
MEKCEFYEACPFFNDTMANMPSLAEMMKDKYCRKDFKSCARYQVRITGKTTPPDLFPNQVARVKEILAGS